MKTMRILLALMPLMALFAYVLSGFSLAEAEELNEFQQMEKMNHRGIWDGNFTKAKSGLGWELPDSGSSEGKSGVKDAPLDFYVLPHDEINRMYDEVERDEISNVGKIRDYSTEALLQFPQSMTFNGKDVPGGYYLAYLGDWYSGSKEINMGHAEEWVPVELQKQRAKGELKEYSAVILKKLGRVVAAFPIDSREPYNRKKGEPKAKKAAFGRVETAVDGQVKLSIYYKKWIYHVNTGATEKPIVYPAVNQGQKSTELPVRRELRPLN